MFALSKYASHMDRLGIYFNNYAPENIVFAKGREARNCIDDPHF
jgi:hypothetical protein